MVQVPWPSRMLLGANNAFLHDASSLQMIGKAKDAVDQPVSPVCQAAQSMIKAGIGWCIVGNSNYGEGSSRGHAAL
ncbi:hypothetical protein LZ30DRAFT_707235 [Colletotrichum cereale]|nr:hypothetical protein LZ30DRAFT_707235 [Colletotrichum cereale]